MLHVISDDLERAIRLFGMINLTHWRYMILLALTFLLTIMNSILLLIIYLNLPKRDITQEAIDQALANDRKKREQQG
jgi:hypothetical protein